MTIMQFGHNTVLHGRAGLVVRSSLCMYIQHEIITGRSLEPGTWHHFAMAQGDEGLNRFLEVRCIVCAGKKLCTVTIPRRVVGPVLFSSLASSSRTWYAGLFRWRARAESLMCRASRGQ